MGWLGAIGWVAKLGGWISSIGTGIGSAASWLGPSASSGWLGGALGGGSAARSAVIPNMIAQTNEQGGGGKSAAKTTGKFLQGAGSSLAQGGRQHHSVSGSQTPGSYGGGAQPPWLSGIQQYLTMLAAKNQDKQFPLD